MIRFILFIWNYLIEYASANIIDLATLTLLCYGGWKLFTNHLRHIQIEIQELKKSQQGFKKVVNEKFNSIHRFMVKINEQIKVRDALCQERHPKKAKK